MNRLNSSPGKPGNRIPALFSPARLLASDHWWRKRRCQFPASHVNNCGRVINLARCCRQQLASRFSLRQTNDETGPESDSYFNWSHAATTDRILELESPPTIVRPAFDPVGGKSREIFTTRGSQFRAIAGWTRAAATAAKIMTGRRRRCVRICNALAACARLQRIAIFVTGTLHVSVRPSVRRVGSAMPELEGKGRRRCISNNMQRTRRIQLRFGTFFFFSLASCCGSKRPGHIKRAIFSSVCLLQPYWVLRKRRRCMAGACPGMNQKGRFISAHRKCLRIWVGKNSLHILYYASE